MNAGGPKISTRIPGVSTQMLDYAAVYARLRSGRTLVTANSRLTRVLTGRYNQWCVENGEMHWRSPDVCSWNQWINRLWDAATLMGCVSSTRAVPGNRQLINLWENTLGNETLPTDLIRPESLASALRDARQLITEWQIDPDHPAWHGHDNENHAAFHQWNQAFDRYCRQHNWIDPDDRIAILGNIIGRHGATLQGPVDLLGFDEFSPARQHILAAFVRSGVSPCLLTITPRRGRAVLWKSADSRDELSRMARWVRYWAEEEPGSSIAIAVPDLQARRADIERVLGQILTPRFDNAERPFKPWNISMGIPLLRVPLIQTAFDLLKLLDDRISIQDSGRILRSPWLRGSERERNSRALLEKCLRDKYPRQLELGELIFRAGEIRTRDRHNQPLPEEEQGPQAWQSPLLLTSLMSLARFKKQYRKSQAPSAWAEQFDQLLLDAGWLQHQQEQPQSRQQAAENWQALQTWGECLRELASLDATSPFIGRSAAINELRQICREKIFQAHTPPALIQVLGLYEISGLRFDHLWVLGLYSDNWPASARPNPFIPGSLQRLAESPGSSPERELDVARTITQRLLDTAPDCVFSYPGQQDGEDTLPSPLFATAEIHEAEDIPGWRHKDWCDTVAAAPGPQLDSLEMPGRLVHATARGGSSILKHQALCPFRAFASNRLGAEGMETPEDGISAKLHGSLVHEVLEGFWKETRTRAALLQLEPQALSERVRKHIAAVTDEQRGLRQRPAFLEVESDRLHRHVMNYLALESQREEFEVIGFEEEILPAIEGQEVRLVIDRIDRLPSGEQIIIDYKTGKVDPKKWFGERPDDPQLPLYAISAAAQPAAVAFGVIREDGCGFKGIVTREGLLPGLPPRETAYTREQVEAGRNMPQTIIEWRQTLHSLMTGFIGGHAVIDPKAANTCRNTHCKLQPLCRINELRQGCEVSRPAAESDVRAEDSP
jgi:probable DNA repair protein